MVYNLFMVICGMVYYCFTHIVRVCLFFEPFQKTQLAHIAVVSYDHGFALFSFFAHVINNMPFDLPCWRGNQTTLGIPSQYWVLEVVLMVFKLKKIFGGSSLNCGVHMFKNISRRSLDGWRNTQVASWASCCWYPANCCHFLVRTAHMGPVQSDPQSIHPRVLVDLLIYLHQRKHSIIHTQIKKITKSRLELSETKACRHTILANESSWLGIEHSFETVLDVIRGFIHTVPEINLASLRKQLDVRVFRRLNTGLSPIHDLSNIDIWHDHHCLAPQKKQALRVVHLLR